MTPASAKPKHCDHCGAPMELPPTASHKRFCSTHCRQAWHSAQRTEGLKLLREKQEAEGQKQDSES